MDPRWLFPVLAAVFAVAAALRFAREKQFVPAVRTWALMAVIFAAVSIWLHYVAA